MRVFIAAALLLLGASIPLAFSQAAPNELGRVEQFEAQLKAEETVFTHPTDLKMPNLAPIPTRCMDDMLRRAEVVFNRNVARRRRSFLDADRPSVADEDDLVSKFFRPLYPCSLEQRVGTGGEGGKWVCRGTQRMQLTRRRDMGIVSVGSHGITAFEEDMNRIYGAITDTFDPYMPAPSLAAVEKLPYMRMHTSGLLGTREAEEWRMGSRAQSYHMVTISELLQIIERDRVDVFKVDCESCEYGFADDLAGIRSSSQVLGQILMEVHYFNFTDRFMRLMFGLESVGYRLFHAENNAYWGNAYELAFLHESQLQPVLTPEAGALSARDVSLCYSAFAHQAEAIFDANWARKQKRFVERGDPEIPRHLKWADAVAHFMMGDYPCQLAERFGVWGRGGASVCTWHKDRCPGVQDRERPGVILTIGGKETDAGSRDLLFEHELATEIQAVTHIFNPRLETDRLYPRESDSRPAIIYHDRYISGPLFANGSEYITLRQAMDFLIVESIQVLRIDCRGCEFELVDEMQSLFMADPSAVPVGQIVVRVSQHRNTQPILRTLGLLGFRNFMAEQTLKEFDVSMIHRTCL